MAVCITISPSLHLDLSLVRSLSLKTTTQPQRRRTTTTNERTKQLGDLDAASLPLRRLPRRAYVKPEGAARFFGNERLGRHLCEQREKIRPWSPFSAAALRSCPRNPGKPTGRGTTADFFFLSKTLTRHRVGTAWATKDADATPRDDNIYLKSLCSHEEQKIENFPLALCKNASSHTMLLLRLLRVCVCVRLCV